MGWDGSCRVGWGGSCRGWGVSYKGGVESHLSDKSQIKLLSELLPFTFNFLQMTQSKKILTCRVLKIHEWIWQDVYEWGKVS